MAKISQKVFVNMAEKWLKKNGWESNDWLEGKIIVDKQLEEFPYKPDFLIENEGYQFWVNIFDKEDHFYSKTLGCWVTGFDYWKYQMLMELEKITNIPAAVLFYSEEDKEFIFKAIRELNPHPIIWQRGECLQTQYKRHDYYFKCVKCRKDHHKTFHNCVFRKTKRRPMAVWRVDEFRKNTNFQTAMAI
jgi:hypothetical protein